MPVYQQQVRPAVVIEVKEPASPAYKASVLTQARFHADVFELALATVAVQGFQFVREVGPEDRGQPLMQVVGRRYSHAGHCFAVLVESSSAHQCLVGELSVPQIDVKNGGRLITRDIDVGQPVSVEIRCENAEGVV